MSNIKVDRGQGIIRMDYDAAKSIVKRYGWEEWIEFISDYFPDYKLGGCGQDWYDNRKYICKFRGQRGDVLVLWNE